jgi:secreted PhoX family phosphatase
LARGTGQTFQAILKRRLSRRTALKGVGATALVAAVGAIDTAGAGAQALQPGGAGIWFEPIAPQPVDGQQVVVARGHTAEVLIKWGDPVTADAPAFDPAKLSRASQEKQFGYNNDYVGFHPLPYGSGSSERGLLWANHEYTNPELMWAGYTAQETTKEMVDVELAAHGGSIVELQRVGGKMQVVRSSPHNRRITGFTPMRLSGPAVGHDWLRTREDPSGVNVTGMLNNCAGGYTPWGTVLTCEENFHQYFGNAAKLPATDQRTRVHARYGMPAANSERRWENHYERFDVSKEPNEAFRFGWVVEIDPYDASSQPVKRTALGRVRHEGATFAVSPSGRVAFYSGDDERFDYVYKFVTSKAYDAGSRAANRDLLDDGTLYVARFDDDGSGRWLPLVYGQGSLTSANGFTSQADVLLKTRLAGDAVGATKMDRPEDIQQNPANKKIYMAMTNNNQRGGENRPRADKANPRVDNRWGHVIEVTEANDDVAATTFRWDIFMLCGDPKNESTYFAGFDKSKVSPIAAPDNVNFDAAGNLWISTDGQPAAIRQADQVIVIPTAGPQRGNAQSFMSAVIGAEMASLEFTPDNRTFFASIQHPGEESTFEKPSTRWPEGGGQPPKPAVVQVWNDAGGRVGVTLAQMALAPAAAPAAGPAPTALPRTGGVALGTAAVLGAAAAAAGGLLRARGRRRSIDC